MVIGIWEPISIDSSVTCLVTRINGYVFFRFSVLLVFILLFIDILSRAIDLDSLYIIVPYVAVFALAVLGLFLRTEPLLIHYLTVFMLFFALAMYGTPGNPKVHIPLLLKFAALIGYVAVTSFLPIMVCYEKFSLSLKNILTGLKMIKITSEKLIIRLLEKAFSYAIIIAPLSVAVSYLLIDLGMVNTQTEFSTFALRNFFILIGGAFYIEVVYKLSKMLPKIIKVVQLSKWEILGVVFYYVASPMVFVIPAYYVLVLLEFREVNYTPETFNNALNVLVVLFFFLATITAIDCRLKKAKKCKK